MKESVTRIVALGAFWTSGSTVATKLISMVTMFIILRSLSVYEYGQVELVMSIPPLLSMFTMPGLSAVVIADMGRARGNEDWAEVKRVFLGYVRVIFVFSLIPFVLTWGAALFFMQGYDPLVRQMVEVMSLLFPIAAFTTGSTILFRVFLQFNWGAWATTSYELVKLIAIASMFFIWGAGPFLVIIANVLADTCSVLIVAPKSITLLRSFLSARTVPQPLLAPLRDHGKWGVASAYVSALGTYIRPWLIKLTLGTEAVGLFAAAQGLIQHTFSLMPLAALIQPILPQYADKKEQYYRIIRKFLKYQLLSGLALTVVAFIAFPPILGILFPKYVESFGLFRFMLLVFAANAVSPIIAGIFYAAKRQRNLTLAFAGRTLATIVLLPPLALAFGVFGAGAEYILTQYIFQFERLYMVRRFMPDLTFPIRSLVTFDEYDQLLINKARARLRTIRERN